ncbi:MAG: DUF3501 family protein [Candidatus Dormiibacterota bacterium]
MSVTSEGTARLGLDEVRAGSVYEAARADARRGLAESKGVRRVRLSDTLALVFENRATIRSILEETLRTERVDDPDRIAGEIAAFNAVVPEPGQLGALLFLEVADPADLAAAASDLERVEHCIFVEVAGSRTRGIPEAVAPPGESAPAHFMRFSLDPEQRAAILSGSPIIVGAEHPSLSVSVALDNAQRHAIAADL